MIGTNKKDALETVNTLLEDLEAGPGPRARAGASQPIEELLDERGGDHVTYLGWQAIDRAEVAAGEPHGRPRVKFCRVARDGRGGARRTRSRLSDGRPGRDQGDDRGGAARAPRSR